SPGRRDAIPSFAIGALEESVRARDVLHLGGLRIPLERLLREAERHVPEKHRLGERPSVAEVGRSLPVAADGAHPFLVVIALLELGEALAVELRGGVEPGTVPIEEERALLTDEKDAVLRVAPLAPAASASFAALAVTVALPVPTTATTAGQELERRMRAAVVPRHAHGLSRGLLCRREVVVDDASLLERL